MSVCGFANECACWCLCALLFIHIPVLIRSNIWAGIDPWQVRVWEPVTGECKRLLRFDTQPLYAMWVNISGELFVGAGSSIIYCDGETGAIIPWHPHTRPSTRVHTHTHAHTRTHTHTHRERERERERESINSSIHTHNTKRRCKHGARHNRT